jgi:hypothetical protein
MKQRRRSYRTEVVGDAIGQTTDSQVREDEIERRRKRREKAARTMDRLARKAGNWPAVEILREWRYRLEKSI